MTVQMTMKETTAQVCTCFSKKLLVLMSTFQITQFGLGYVDLVIHQDCLDL